MATFVHYLVMLFVIRILHVNLYGLAYAFAFIFAVFVSFLGNKRFVFRKSEFHQYQFMKFVLLYICLLCLTSLTMWVVSDYGEYDYNIGFIVAGCLQFLGGYLGSRYFNFHG